MYIKATQLHPKFAAKFATYSKLFEEAEAELSTLSGDGYVWRVARDGRSVVFLSDALPFNSAAASIIARDKLATYQVLATAPGLRIPAGLAFFSETHNGRRTSMERRFLISALEDGIAEKWTSAEVEEGLVVKPGTESGGVGVQLCCGMREIREHAGNALVYSHYGLAQEFVGGHEYRVAFLGDEVLTVYRKRNPAIRGDGRSTLRQLLMRFNVELGSKADPAFRGQKISRLVRSSGIAIDEIVPLDREVEIELESRNLARGARPELLESPPPDVMAAARSAHKAVGLTYSGVDIKAADDGTQPCVLEVNANPGFSFLQRFYPEVADGIQRRIAAEILRFLN